MQEMPYVTRRVVNLLEILRAYVEVYTEAAYAAGLMGGGKRLTEEMDKTLLDKVRPVVGECKKLGLLCTLDSAESLCRLLERPRESWNDQVRQATFSHLLVEMTSRLDLELSHRLFIKMPDDRRVRFDTPCIGWEDVVTRFSDAITDIEEANRCYALSRYAAAVFHSVQIVEIGLIDLGNFLGVKDPLSGWTAVANELKRIVGTNYKDRSDFEKKHLAFIEQAQATVEALKNAWRNKISHAHGRLALMTSDIVPDVAEEILMATRAFMNRLSHDLP